jgi:molybdopterin converting factor small subunit
MATLRLFANLRESAGTNRVSFEADTVGAMLNQANLQFGERFATGAKAAGVWVNGQPADSETALTASDEVALIPPVSGGALAATNLDFGPNLLSVALFVALIAVSWADPAWFAFVAVGAVLAWVWDLSESAKQMRDAFVVFPPLIGATLGAVGAYAWGFEGFAGAMALGVIIAVSWSVFDSSHREFRTTAATTLVTVIATGATAGLVLIRLTGSYAVVAFVLVTVFALVGAWIAGAYGASIQSVDANVGALLGALLAGLLSGLLISEMDIAAGLLGGVAAAAGVIAGRTLGSMLRTGAISHTEDPPGALSMFDGAALAAPLFWIAIWLFS